MSWDVIMIRTKTNNEAIDEIKSKSDNLSWQNLNCNSWSIEYNTRRKFYGIQMQCLRVCF